MGTETPQRKGEQWSEEVPESGRRDAPLHPENAWRSYPDSYPEGLGNARQAASAESETGQSAVTAPSQSQAPERTGSWWAKFYEDHNDQAEKQRTAALAREASARPVVRGGYGVLVDRIHQDAGQRALDAATGAQRVQLEFDRESQRLQRRTDNGYDLAAMARVLGKTEQEMSCALDRISVIKGLL